VKPWLIYTRVSTEDQAREGVSLDAQRCSCESMAKALSLPVAEVITDAGISAKNMTDRPGVTRVMAAIEAGTVAGVIIYKLDRLTRSRRDLEDLLDRLSQTGAGLISVSEKLDTSSAMGRFFVAMLGSIAQWERETIAERVQGAMDFRKTQGGFVGGPVPAGLRAVGGPGQRVLEVDPTWGQVVQRIWPAIIGGKTLRQVADMLIEAKLPTGRTGSRWQPTTVRKVALNSRYVGVLCTQEQLDQVRAALAARWSPKQPGRPSQRVVAHSLRPWMLSGLAVCGQCGGHLVGVTSSNASGKVYHWYRCSTRTHHGRARCDAKDLRAEPWEDAVVLSLVRNAQEAGKIVPALVEYAELAAKGSEDAQLKRRELTLARDKAAVEISRLVELAATGGATAQALAKPIAERQQALDAIHVNLAGYEAELHARSMSTEQTEQLLVMLRKDIDRLPELPPEEQSLAVRMLVSRVVLRPIDKQTGEVDLSINLPRLLGNREFVSQCRMVVVGALRTTLEYTDQVVLRAG
jgi:site-specific DNA recombinase